jgi:hypothetical protein
VLLQHLGAIGGLIAKLLPVGISCLQKTPDPACAATPAPVSSSLEGEVVDARIARIISEIPQRRVRRHA